MNRLPLAGKRILVTRAPAQASGLAEELSKLGAIPILIPTIEIVPPASFRALDAALTSLHTFDWLLFTSANAVRAFDRRSHVLGIAPKPRRIAVVGPATARAVEAIGLKADLIPPIYTAESLVQALAPEACNLRVLLLRPEDPILNHPDSAGAPSIAVLSDGWDVKSQTDPLWTTLTAYGATVTVAPAYANRIPAESLAALTHLFSSPANYPDAVTFTSASTARHLAALLGAANLTLPDAVVRASIGPVTSQALRELGLPPHHEAAEAIIPALAAALAAHFNRC